LLKEAFPVVSRCFIPLISGLFTIKIVLVKGKFAKDILHRAGGTALANPSVVEDLIKGRQ